MLPNVGRNAGIRIWEMITESGNILKGIRELAEAHELAINGVYLRWRGIHFRTIMRWNVKH